jgi:PAS domain S-box-containing protein
MSLPGDLPPAPAATDEEIGQVLLAVADGSYVLSTPEGAVAECGIGVVGLLGAPADQLVGRATIEVLIPDAGEGVRAAFDQLLLADGDHDAARRIFRSRTPGGATRSLQFVVVAVPLALGWEFTSLLSELGSRDAGTWHPEALRLRHGRALEAIEGVVREGHQPDPEARLAGILIVVRDVDAPPLTREDVARRMAEHREAARAAAAEAARRADATIGRADDQPESDGGGLEDLVERARILRERVEEAERECAVAVADRDHALAQLAAAHAERAELQDARGESAVLQGQITALRAELEAAHREVEVARGEALVAAAAERDALREELERTRGQLRESSSELESVRAQLGAIRGELEHTREELATTLAAAEGARAEREQARLQAGELLSEAEAARAAAEAIRAEFAFDAPAPAPAASQPSDSALVLPPSGPGEALALIGLDGAFKRLDDAFCALLGYREADLRAARWPSVIDRENLPAHQEIARALRAGEIHSAPVETVYMHAQGLLVPIAGTVSMHRAAGTGPATHYLFRADVRRTSGP